MQTVETIQQAHVSIVTKAIQDPVFKAELMANPRAVLERELGTSIPESLAFQVVEAPANTHVIVLPHIPEALGELSDTDLESVAGGKDNPPMKISTLVPGPGGVVPVPCN